MSKLDIAMLLSCMALGACSDDSSGEYENEVITTVILNFAPTGGATPIKATFDDPDGDGGMAPTIDPVNLSPGNYTLTVQFQNKLASDPAEQEITNEIRDEKSFHLLLFTGSAVVGPATSNTTGPLTQSYADTDDNGLPIGLSDMITASAGTGMLTVTLRNVPPEEPPVKAANTVILAKAGASIRSAAAPTRKSTSASPCSDCYPGRGDPPEIVPYARQLRDK